MRCGACRGTHETAEQTRRCYARLRAAQSDEVRQPPREPPTTSPTTRDAIVQDPSSTSAGARWEEALLSWKELSEPAPAGDEAEQSGVTETHPEPRRSSRPTPRKRIRPRQHGRVPEGKVSSGQPVTFCPYCASDEHVDSTAVPPRCDIHGSLGVDAGSRVYVSQGWKAIAYHNKSSCHWLKSGQASVAASGGDPANIISVSRLTAEARGLAPCRHCC